MKGNSLQSMRSIVHFGLVGCMVFISLFTVNCNRDDEPIEDPVKNTDTTVVDSNEVNRVVFTPSKESLFPTEMVYLGSSKTLSTDLTYTTSIAGQELPLVLSGDSGLIAIIPIIEKGSYTLNIEGIDAEPVSIEVLEKPAVQDPQTVVKGFTQRIASKVTELEAARDLGYFISEEEMSQVRAFSAEVDAQIAQLSAEDLEQLALFLEVNVVDTMVFRPIEINDSLYSNKKDGNGRSPEEELERLGNAFAISFTSCIITLEPLYNLVRLAPANPWMLTGAGVLTGVSVTSFLMAKSYAAQIGELRGIADRMSDELNKKTLSFKSGKERRVYPQIVYRTMIWDDRTNTLEWISKIASRVLKFNATWRNMVSYVEDVEELLGTDLFDLPNEATDIDDAPDYKEIKANPESISFVSATGGISLESRTEGNAIYLKATGSETKSFTFYTKYNVPQYEIQFQELITAEFVAFELTGIWHFRTYADDTRTVLNHINELDAQNGLGDPVLSIRGYSEKNGWEDVEEEYQDDNGFTQSFFNGKLDLDHNFFSNVTYRFDYDADNPRVLLGQCIGLCNKGYNLELVKQ